MRQQSRQKHNALRQIGWASKIFTEYDIGCNWKIAWNFILIDKSHEICWERMAVDEFPNS